MEAAAGILGSPPADLQRFVVNHGGCVHAVIHGGEVHKRLKCGTRLALGKYRAVELVLAPSAYHGFDIAVGGIDGNQAYLRLGQMVRVVGPYIGQITDGRLCFALQAAVQGGVDLQTAFI